MHKVARFEKVSFKEYEIARNMPCQDEYSQIKLPVRATKGSAGYDFFSPFDFTLNVGESIKIPTGIRAKIKNGWALFIFPRSSMGFKFRMQLDNTVGIVDSDYYFSDNEGHIFIKITNDSKDGKVLSVKKCDAFAQGVFLPFGITYTDRQKRKRNGGIGSTSR